MHGESGHGVGAERKTSCCLGRSKTSVQGRSILRDGEGLSSPAKEADDDGGTMVRLPHRRGARQLCCLGILPGNCTDDPEDSNTKFYLLATCLVASPRSFTCHPQLWSWLDILMLNILHF